MALADIIDQLVQGGTIRKRTRFTRLIVQYPDSVQTPYNEHNGVPFVVRSEILRNIASWDTTEQDSLAAAQITIQAANTTEGVFTDMVLGNDLLRLEERYTNGADLDTNWITIGTYLVDTVSPSTEGTKNSLQITGRDALKWLTLDGLEDRFWADTVRVNNRRLVRKADPYEADVNTYVFVDGGYDDVQQRWIQTINWSDKPVPRVYDDKGRRVSASDGAIEVNYGVGEVYIDAEYYESALLEAGLGHPKYLTISYARFLEPEDERDLTVTAVSDDQITLSLDAVSYLSVNGQRTPTVAPYSFPDWLAGLTVVVLDGPAKNTRFRIKRTHDHTLTLDRSAAAEGLEAGWRVRIGEANRIESAIERLFLDAGFQNVDPDKPFYIAEIVQSQPQLVLPTVQDFDYTLQRRTSFLKALQAWLTLMPPYTQLFADEDGDIHLGSVFQRNEADYALSDALVSAQVESTDSDIITRVVYQVRDRARKDLCATSTGALKKFTWFDEINKKFLKIYPLNLFKKKSKDSFALQAQHALFDRRGNTGVEIVNPSAKSVTETTFDNKLIFQVEFDREYHLGEIQLRSTGYFYGSSADQWWQIEYSVDGIFWDILGDEFAMNSGPVALTTQDFGDDIWARFLRVRLNFPSKFFSQTEDTSQLLTKGIIISGTEPPTKTVQLGGQPFIIEPVLARSVLYAAIATFSVFEYDIVDASAELGVDRFSFVGNITAVEAGYVETNVVVESSWVNKLFLANNAQFTITDADPAGPHPQRLVLDKNPATAGLEVGDGFLIQDGERDADFARDVTRRQRLGRRTKIVEPIDEVGFFIVQSINNQGFAYALSDYAHDKAMEYLGELSREFFPATLKSIRPDARLRQTVLADVRRLGFVGNVLVRELQRSSDGSRTLKGTPFKDMLFGTGTTQFTASTTRSTTESTTESETTTDTTTATTTAATTHQLSTTTHRKLW